MAKVHQKLGFISVALSIAGVVGIQLRLLSWALSWALVGAVVGAVVVAVVVAVAIAVAAVVEMTELGGRGTCGTCPNGVGGGATLGLGFSVRPYSHMLCE